MSITSISEAKLRLYHLVREAEGGEDVVLEYEGRPIVAKANDCPLLYVGNDFARTDVRSTLG